MGQIFENNPSKMLGPHYHIDRTETSPQIDLDIEAGTLEFVGRSLPSNADLFYSRVHNWLEMYMAQPQKETTVNMRMDYLDTSSSKHLYNIFNKLDAVTEQGRKVTVNWHYEAGDDEMAETGKDYESLFKLEFAFIEVQDLF